MQSVSDLKDGSSNHFPRCGDRTWKLLALSSQQGLHKGVKEVARVESGKAGVAAQDVTRSWPERGVSNAVCSIRGGPGVPELVLVNNPTVELWKLRSRLC